MSNAPIIKVQVDDSQFKAFLDLYQVYQEHLESAPEEWKATGEAIEDAAGEMGGFAESTKASKDFLLIAATQSAIIADEIRKASSANNALLESLTKNTKAQKSFADETERGNESLKKMKEHAEGVAGSVFGIGKWLLKLGAWGAGLAGLGGILGGLGLKDLAESAVNTQRGARGLGMTPGQLTAFNQDFGGRYLDQSVLGAVANAQNSFAGRVWLSRASGEAMGQVSSEDPGQLAAQLAIRAHNWWANTPANMRTAEMLQSSGFAQSGFSLSMMRQLGNTPLAELQRAASQYRQDQGRFNVGDNNTDAWYSFLRQIKDAGNTIETDLKNKLVALAPDLQHFVEVIGKDAMKLVDDIFTPANLSAIEDGINAFTSYLGSSQFQQDMKDFAGLVGALAGAMRKAAKFLGIDTTQLPSSSPTGSANIQVNPGLDPSEVQRETHGQVTGYGGISNIDKALGYTRHFLTMPQHPTGPYADPKAADEAKDLLAALDAKNGLPSGTLAAMWAKESSEGKNLVGPVLSNGDQAIGDFQFTSDTWKQWGKGGDRFNFKDEANSAGSYMSFLLKKYKGDIKEALAAYDWGSGNVDKAISKNGANWQNSLPAETRDYIKIAAALKRQPQSVKVTVNNNTSARVAVQANAAAAQ
jgi:hypothetical protein